MSQQPQYKLQLKVEISESFILEDNEYFVTYYIKNIGKTDFPAGATFECRLRYPHWGESYAVMHKWWGTSLKKIGVGCTIKLPTNKIKAVAGPNAIVFYQLKPSGQYDCKVVDIHDNVMGKGSFVHYYRVLNIAELNSQKNLKIAASALKYSLYSFIIMGSMGFIDWFLQLWLNDIWCLQNVLYASFPVVIIAGILIMLVRAKYNSGLLKDQQLS